MRILLIIAMLLVSAAGAMAQVDSGGVAVVPDLSPAGRFDLMREVDKRYGRTLEIIKAEFPNDYPALMSGIAAISWQGGQEDRAMLAAFGLITELRKKYADRLMFAPSASHAVMLGFLADFYVTVFKAEGPQVCGRFAQDGSGVLFELGLSGKYADALDRQSLAYFDAVVKAIEAPEYAGAVVEADWGAVVKAMIVAGAPESFVRTISSGDRTDPDLCPALAAMFSTSSILDTPEGKRTRADFAKNLAGY
jgi:hypothetical protein